MNQQGHMNQQIIDAAITLVAEKKTQWARLPISRKVALLQAMQAGLSKTAGRQVAKAAEVKGYDIDSPQAGQEYLAGPVVTMRCLRLLEESLHDVQRYGAPRLPHGAVRTRQNGQVAVKVFPRHGLEKLLYPGFSAEVWMQSDVTLSNLSQSMAGFYRQQQPQGRLCLVLGAGNVSSIGPLDVAYKMFVEGAVCVLKMNPVNDYLAPFIEEAFACLIDEGYLRLVNGGADVGAYVCNHAAIDEIHITGSDKTHDAIVFGTGTEGLTRKQRNEPLNQKPITSELGNVSPVIVVPGLWTEKELQFQAENIVTQMANNGGFNCNAAKVLVLHDKWPQRGAFLDAIRELLRRYPLHRAYYPGARDRYAQFVAAHPEAEQYGAANDEQLPWTLITGIDSGNTADICFTTESFCSITAETTIGGADALAFLKNAVAFCNDVVWGTLNVALIVHPTTAAVLGRAVEDAIADLRYGTVAVNHWPALAYGLGVTSWGAFPGHELNDVRSGIGVVHNTYLFDKPQKSVVYGPFRLGFRPPWFLTHRKIRKLAPKLLAFEREPALWRVPAIAANAITG